MHILVNLSGGVAPVAQVNQNMHKVAINMVSLLLLLLLHIIFELRKRYTAWRDLAHNITDKL